MHLGDIMKVTYIPLKSVKKNVFRQATEKEEGQDFSEFIESLKKIDVNDTNVIAEIKLTLKKLTQDKAVEEEILKRLEE